MSKGGRPKFPPGMTKNAQITFKSTTAFTRLIDDTVVKLNDRSANPWTRSTFINAMLAKAFEKGVADAL
jgi:hypothetical protein